MHSLKTLYCLLLLLIVVSLPSKAQFVLFDGTKINYEMQGEGLSVVLIHGYIVNGDMCKKSTAASEGFAEAVLQFLYANR